MGIRRMLVSDRGLCRDFLANRVLVQQSRFLGLDG
jgi:hypothetical protein